MENTNFDPAKWVNDFRIASANLAGFRELRAEIFTQTAAMVRQGGYILNGKEFLFDNKETFSMTHFYDKPGLLEVLPSNTPTRFSVVESDCLEIADLMGKSGHTVTLLNMANRNNPGGGVLGGAGAQEENLFRRSNLLMSLFQFVDYAPQYNVLRNDRHSYPLNRDTGGIYSQAVTIFRGSETNGYCLLHNPFKISVVTVPAISRPPLQERNGQLFIADELVEASKEKIRTLLRISGRFNRDCLILSAFGCGAFGNPPHHMARLFRQVFHEEEFRNQFRLVIFAIIDDHNARRHHNPEGNLIPFFRVFDQEQDV